MHRGQGESRRRAEAKSGTQAALSPNVSFEFFPPRTPQAEAQLWATISALAPLSPRFVSVTCGAGGSSREATFATVQRIFASTRLHPAAHLICVGQARSEIRALLEQYWQAGIRHVVALRGDPPIGRDAFDTHPDGFSHASDLVAFIKTVADFEISVAAYPETHPQALSPASDLDYLKRKIDAGATRAITQFFFDNRRFLDFYERAAKAGITAEIVPGILPVTSYAQTVKFSALCGASIPSWLAELFDGLDADQDTRKLVAAMVATEQCRALQAEGIGAFHFYTLNRADLTLGICRRLGLKPAPLPDLPGFKHWLSDATPPLPRDPEMPD
jgi:methylenetetrahydrofolate reductase (NADPH)